jgi:hypothetical protein
MAQNPRLQILQENIKGDMSEIDKRTTKLSLDEDAKISKPPDTSQLSWESEMRPFVEDMKIGQLGPNIQGFCPMKLLSKFPFIFLSGKLAEDVTELFFMKDEFWEFRWVL